MRSMKPTALAGSIAIAACLLAPPALAQTTGTGATETGSTGATQSSTTTNRNDTGSGSMGSVSGTQSTTTGTSSTDINRSDTNRATTTTTGTAASDVSRTSGTTTDTDRELPRTASSFPLVAAIGILSLAAAITLRRVSGRHAV